MKIVSVRRNSDNIFASSDENFSFVCQGHSIRIASDKVFYEVLSCEKILQVKEFTADNSSTLRISLDEDNSFMLEDSIVISFKEYELKNIKSINAAGKGYKKGDILTVDSSNCRIETETGLPLNSKIEVKEVDDKGSIKDIKILNNGCYTIQPQSTHVAIGGSGNNAILHLDFGIIEQRRTIERVISKVIHRQNNTLIELNVELPENIKSGKVSVQKWKLKISQPYQGYSNPAAKFEIIKDYFPNSNIPMMLPGSGCKEQIFNMAMRRAIQRIADLENQVKELSSRIGQ